MKPVFKFPRAEHYAFFYEEAHLMLVTWERDEKKELYLISNTNDDVLELDYAGELYTERVMEMVTNIFFVTVQEESKTNRYALAAFLNKNEKDYAVYYERDTYPPKELIFFRVHEDGGRYNLEVVEDPEEYKTISGEIEARYASFVHIQ